MDNEEKVREDNLCDVLTDKLFALPSKVDADGYKCIHLGDAFWAVVQSLGSEEWVNVTRCKDCIHNATKRGNRQQFYQWCDLFQEWREPEYFCSDGGRE